MTDRPSPPADVYTREYYLTRCEGAPEFRETGGHTLTECRARVLSRCTEMLPGARVLDVGCGRGELVVAAARAGATLAVGMDFSAAAVALAQETIQPGGPAIDVSGRVMFVRGDARVLPFAPRSFDLVLSTDVIEHLVPDEARAMLQGMRSALRPGGALVLHTTPNRWWMRYGYYVFYAVSPSHRRSYGTLNARRATFDSTHVNEQSPWSLRRALADVGFDSEVQVEEFNFAPRSGRNRLGLKILTGLWPLKLICANHLFAVAYAR
jgi:2-polyprenyl-3-methyl-5-hydroxy-6-metoxy-1,4-benzoquinol methylase